MKNNELIIYGHRGIPTLHTENTLKGFKNILDYNIRGVELDVHLTVDDKLVVIHDYNTLNMRGVDHNITDTEYAVIEKLKIGDSEKIPLLSEVFDLLKDKVQYDLEVKSSTGNRNRRRIVKKLYELIDQYNLTDNCMVSSFDPLILNEFHRLKTGIPTAYIYCNDNDVPFLLRYGLGAFLTNSPIIKPHHSLLKGVIFFILTKLLKKECYTWTVNSVKDFKYVISRGCKWICSDNPHLFTEL